MTNLLATRFAKNSPQITSRTPLDDEALRAVVPSPSRCHHAEAERAPPSSPLRSDNRQYALTAGDWSHRMRESGG